MKQYIFSAMAILAMAAMQSCTTHEEKEIETNERGVPMSIANMIMGDVYKIDTLYKTEDQSVILINNPIYTQYILYTGEKVLANDPSLNLDSIAYGVYSITEILREARVNFANAHSVSAFESTFPQYQGFSTIVVGDTSQVGQKAIFAYAMDVPNESFKHSADILKWLEKCVDDTIAYNPSAKALGQKIGKAFFNDWNKRESDFTYTDSRSLLVYEMTPTYLTYHDYSFIFLGGAHGMYGDRLVTYMLDRNCPLTYDLLFKPDCEEEIRELIYEALAADDDFMTSHKLTSLSQARSYVQRNLMGEPLPIPDPGLLTQGVVFCYQPYEIGPYADGAFQLVVPYDKISPYMLFDPSAETARK